MVRGAGRPAAAAAVAPGQQPQADPGLLPRARASPTHGRDPRDRQARQARPRTPWPSCSSSDAGATPSRPSGAWRWPRSASPTPRFVDRVRALGVSDDAARRGPGRAGRRWSRAAPTRRRRGSTVEANLRIARGPRLLHRHGLRDPHGGLRAPGRSAPAAATTRSPPTAGRRTPASASPSASPGPWCRCSPRACSTGSRAVPTAVLVALADEDGRPAASAIADAPARPRDRLEVAAEPRRSTASRSGTPSAAASRSSGSPASRERSDQVKDIRSGDQVAADAGRLDAAGRGPASHDRHPRHPGDLPVIRTARGRDRCTAPTRRPDRDARRLGGPAPRPRRRRLHRPARRPAASRRS